jgi:hypothetical protein
MKHLFILFLLLSSSFALDISTPSPQEHTEKSDLVVELKNCRIVGDDSQVIEVDFVMKNTSQKEIVLAERWNSWGAYQWSFKLTDAKGHVFRLGNTQSDWSANALTTFVIPPGKSVVFKCSLCVPHQGFGSATYYGFSAVESHVPNENGVEVFQANIDKYHWEYPIELEGRFSAPIIHSISVGDRTVETNWTGTVVTPKIKFDSRGQIVQGEGRRSLLWVGLAVFGACLLSFVGGFHVARKRYVSRRI